ncbi:MAG: C25 family peptidase propeptide domain-containing protein [Bacillota bacterium]
MLLLFFLFVTIAASVWIPLHSNVESVSQINRRYSSSEWKYYVNINLSGITKQEIIHNNDIYSRISIPGWSKLLNSGSPEIPTKILMFELPEEMTAEVNILNTEIVKLNSLNIYPAQPIPFNMPIETNNIDFFKDQDIYSKDSLFPEQIILNTSVIKLRHKKYFTVKISPVQFNPYKKSADIHKTIDFEISLSADKNTNNNVMRSLSTSKTTNALTSSEFNSITGNSNLFDEFDGDLPEESKKSLIKYMIIMNDQFENNSKLKDFIEWKKMKGNEVTCVLTSDISKETPPTFEQLVDYMQNITDEHYPEYLLLIGNNDPELGVASKNHTIVDADNPHVIPRKIYGTGFIDFETWI